MATKKKTATKKPAAKKVVKKVTKKKTTAKKKKTNDYSDQITNDTMIPAAQAKNILRKIRKHIVTEFDNVGDKFVKEYRKFEKGKRDDKFYGTPSREEVKKLLDEGTDLFHVPEIKEDA